MAEITIRFRRDPATGKKEILIHLESDADALPHEHEKDHKALVEKLLGRPLNDDEGDIKVERITKEGQKTGVVEGQQQPQREAVKSKG
jgi:hypothetical protein